jgi:hypothetical protein
MRDRPGGGTPAPNVHAPEPGPPEPECSDCGEPLEPAEADAYGGACTACAAVQGDPGAILELHAARPEAGAEAPLHAAARAAQAVAEDRGIALSYRLAALRYLRDAAPSEAVRRQAAEHLDRLDPVIVLRLPWPTVADIGALVADGSGTPGERDLWHRAVALGDRPGAAELHYTRDDAEALDAELGQLRHQVPAERELWGALREALR